MVPSVAAAVAAVAALASIFALGIAGLLFYGNSPNWTAVVPEVRAITETLEALSYDNLKAPCATELAQLCRAASTPAEYGACLKKNRDSVSPACEVAIRNQFGGKRFQEPTLIGTYYSLWALGFSMMTKVKS